MDITFDLSSAVVDENNSIRITATVRGQIIECRAAPGAVIVLRDYIEESGLESTTDPHKLALFLLPYWELKIECGKFDDDFATVVTLSEEDIVSSLTLSLDLP